MHIVLTGGTGFIGRYLARRLLEAGHRLHLLVRDPRTGFGPEVDCSIWNAYELEPDPDSLRGADAIIHLAGETVAQRWTTEAKRRILQSRVEGTRRLLASAGQLDKRPAVFLCASAVGYYGSRGEEELNEQSGPGQGFLAEVCKAWEEAARQGEELGMRVVNLRFGMVLGKGGGVLEQLAGLFRWGLGARLGSGEQWMSWVHIEDAAGLIQHALVDDSSSGPLNVCSPEPVRNREFTEMLARQLHRPAFFSVPEKVLRILYGEMAEMLLASQKVIPSKALAAGYEFRFPQLRLALRELLG